MLPGTTPARPDDVGDADPRLAAAIAAGDTTAVRVALLRARILLPVVAFPSDGEAEMAVPALVGDDGARALPIFTSVASMARWREDARPVPMSGARVIAGAVSEGYDGIVLDIAGPVAHTVAGADLTLLARAAVALQAEPTADVVVAPD